MISLEESSLLSNSFFPVLREAFASSSIPVWGVVDISRAEERFSQHRARYQEWMARGFHGPMEYLVRGAERRGDPRLVFPAAKSVLTVLIPYSATPLGEIDPKRGVRYARYLRGSDYHETVFQKVETVLHGVRDKWSKVSDRELTFKVCVDTSAVLERSWAAISGLGWIGKNTLLIHPKLGSFHFIGAALLSEETGVEPQMLPDYCGHCEKCLKACPTEAFVEPHLLDARKCISTWTLETRGKRELSERERGALGNWIAGCDICQEVCPFNHKPIRESAFVETAPHPSIQLSTYPELERETLEEYSLRIKGSALSRVKPEQFKRNLCWIRSSANRPDSLTSL